MAHLEDPSATEAESLDHLIFRQQIQKLHELTVWSRWLLVILLWICVAPLSLWSLRFEIAMWLDYFTWAAVRFSLAYNPVPSFGLALCIGATVAVLVWQSRNILLGLPSSETRHLEQRLMRIRQQGPSHPLWKWVCR